MQGPQFSSSFYRKRKRKDPGNDVEKLVVIMTSLEWGQNDVWLINDMYVRLLLNIWCPWHFPGPFCCYDQFDWCTCIFSLIISHIGTSQVISSARLRMVHLQIYLIFQNCKRLNYSLKYYWINLSVHLFLTSHIDWLVTGIKQYHFQYIHSVFVLPITFQVPVQQQASQSLKWTLLWSWLFRHAVSCCNP